ncbi:MAG: exopolyphosphatase [Bacteroidota bacterium]
MKIGKRVAILDLGTNTFNLLIAEKNGDMLKMIHQSKEISRLGEGGIASNEIAVTAFERGVSALQKHHQTIQHYRCETIIAFATAAIRDASNGKLFAEEVKKQTGIVIETISGEEEAELIWQGTRHALEISSPALIMDIGGGSVEFIIGDREKIYWKKSYRMGVSRLREQFPFTDPATKNEISAVKEFIREFISEISQQATTFSIHTLVGCSGSFDSFADILYQRKTGKKFDDSLVPSYAFVAGELPILLDDLLGSTHEKRAQWQGLSPMRRDFIAYGALLTKEVMEQCQIKNVFLSAYSLKEGILFSRVK